MAKVIGIDFGTTNSLLSVVLDGQARSFLNEKGMPHPSTICYDSDQVVAGTRAKERIDDNDTSMNESLVRSPKVQLAKDNIYINGREKDPVSVVTDLMRFLKQSAAMDRASDDANLDRAVVSIPVAMDGRTRKKLRDALLQAGIQIVQFVHEPLAALYAYFKDQVNFQHTLSNYQGRLALVFDWGGGTLDLTLCRVIDGAVTQVMNVGDNGVGGDYVDEAILHYVLAKHAEQEGVPAGAAVEPGARAKLLNACEKAKIDLSTKEKVLIYVDDYYLGGDFDGDIECTLTRSDLAEISEHFVNRGLSCIDRVLDKLNIDQRQISLCLATGGMVNMPMIRSRLEQIFSIDRLELSDKGDRIISEGCAWIAHDELQMTLAKSIEIAEARGAFLPVFKSGTRLPVEGDAIKNQVGMYCVDPRDGKAKFKIVRPRDVNKASAVDEREPYDLLTVSVDSKAKQFLERIILDFIIDDNFIVSVTAKSSLLGDSSSCEIFDLEFSLSLPSTEEVTADFFNSGFESADLNPELGIVVSRENVVRESVDQNGRLNIMKKQLDAVPGEYLYTYSPRAFDPENGHATKLQDDEKLYYQPCSGCKRRFNDPDCRCSQGF
jgi:molecular chaperone DnaK